MGIKTSDDLINIYLYRARMLHLQSSLEAHSGFSTLTDCTPLCSSSGHEYFGGTLTYGTLPKFSFSDCHVD